MTGQWNPTSKPTTKRVPVAASNDDDGKPRAWVTLRRWRGRERLAYEEALVVRFLRMDADGDETIAVGRTRAFAAALTIVGSEGFPDREDGTGFLSGDDLDVKLADLDALDPDVLAELRDLATRYQPLPGSALAGEDSTRDDEDDEAALPDPSTASSTPPAPTDDAPRPESPASSTKPPKGTRGAARS